VAVLGPKSLLRYDSVKFGVYLSTFQGSLLPPLEGQRCPSS